ncbi:MAG: hypothetical protein ACYTHM_00025 [Planctomycetota bacterium]|jgi:hypothetical protein
MKTRYRLSAFAFLFFLSCLPNDYYLIEMRTKGKVLHRRMTCWRDGGTVKGKIVYGEFPREKLERFSKLYAKRRTPPEAKRHVFEGEFTGMTPNDIGGAGAYTTYGTRMGTLSAYIERSSGHDDMTDTIGKLLEHANRLTDLLIGWFQSELGKKTGFENLRRFLDERFRTDCKNIALYGWTLEAIRTQEAEEGKEMKLRLFRYFVDRGYFGQEELPSVLRGIRGLYNQEDHPAFYSFIKKFLAGKLGLANAKPLPPFFAFLADEKAASKSLEKFLAGTEEYKKRLKMWEEERKTKPDEKKPSPVDLFGEHFLGALKHWFEILTILMDRENVQVKLSCPVQPYATNGDWDAKEKRVNWSFRLLSKAPLPAFVYAFWSLPSTDFQNQKFGKVVLDGENLGEYVLWRKALNELEAKEWDAFVDSLKMAKDLKKRIQNFNFSWERESAEENEETSVKSHANLPCRLILRGLEIMEKENHK